MSVSMGLSDEQLELRDTVRSFLARHPDASWGRFAAELGVAGLAVPEEYGGAGRGTAEAAVVCEELGRFLSPHPYLQTAVLAVEAIRATGDRAAMARLLPGIADGFVTATVLLPGDAELALEGDRLTGSARHALDGELVLAYVGDTLVEAAPSSRTPLPTLDQTRPLVALTFDRVPAVRLGGTGRERVGASAREPADGPASERAGGGTPSGRPGNDASRGWPGPGAAHGRIRDLGVTALAAEQVGGAARCLEAAVAYAKERHQFGRPIGSFQAVKHKLADMLLLVESARSAALAAARAPLEELAVRAAVAGSYCTEAYLAAAAENIQIHGGTGVTWEHPAHRYFKRATADAQLLGPPQAHRARLAAAAGL